MACKVDHFLKRKPPTNIKTKHCLYLEKFNYMYTPCQQYREESNICIFQKYPEKVFFNFNGGGLTLGSSL